MLLPTGRCNRATVCRRTAMARCERQHAAWDATVPALRAYSLTPSSAQKTYRLPRFGMRKVEARRERRTVMYAAVAERVKLVPASPADGGAVMH